jgi:hypothetical protein
MSFMITMPEVLVSLPKDIVYEIFKCVVSQDSVKKINIDSSEFDCEDALDEIYSCLFDKGFHLPDTHIDTAVGHGSSLYNSAMKTFNGVTGITDLPAAHAMRVAKESDPNSYHMYEFYEDILTPKEMVLMIKNVVDCWKVESGGVHIIGWLIELRKSTEPAPWSEISAMFGWADTPEGQDFWMEVHERAVYYSDQCEKFLDNASK